METGRGASHGRLGRSTLAVLCVGFLGGCGGGGSAPQSPTAPPVTTISLAPSSVTTGQSSVLTWSSTGASECSASGAWTGSVATSGTQNVSQATPGSYSYVVTCSGAGGSTANSAALTVTCPRPSSPLPCRRPPSRRITQQRSLGRPPTRPVAWQAVVGPDLRRCPVRRQSRTRLPAATPMRC